MDEASFWTRLPLWARALIAAAVVALVVGVSQLLLWADRV